MDIKFAPKFAIHNKGLLINAPLCACYYCIKTFDFKEIKEWTDNNDTALCPYCAVDAVVPLSTDEREGFLQELHKYWF